MMRYLRLFSRLVLGVVFVFSGLVKAVDPLGSAYKFSDYFNAFGTGFLEFLAVPLAILLSAFEMVLGIVILTGYLRRVSAWVLLVFMGFFTLVTLVLALFNPVSDCWCFGDALILTNWQTFLKNVVLMGFTLLLFLTRSNGDGPDPRRGEYVLPVLLLIAACWFSLWNLNHLPLLDFRPYDVGTVISEEMEIPEGAPVDQYKTTLIYRNIESGEEESFGIENYPRDTMSWAFVTSESKLVSKGYEPPIHDFAISDPYGNDIVDGMLDDPGYTLLMISHDLGAAGKEALDKAADWHKLETLAEDFSFYAVTSSPSAEVEQVTASEALPYQFYTADEIMLKTVVRSNPGFVLLGYGTILGKWAGKDFPALEDIHPESVEMISEASVPMDEEARLLREAGVYGDFSFNVLEFRSLLPSLIHEPGQEMLEKRAVLGIVFAVLLLVLASGYMVPFNRE